MSVRHWTTKLGAGLALFGLGAAMAAVHFEMTQPASGAHPIDASRPTSHVRAHARESVAGDGALRARMIETIQREADARYEMDAAHGAVRADNPAQGLGFRYDGGVARVALGALGALGAARDSTSLSMRFAGVAREGALVPSEHASMPRALGNEVRIARGDVIEWYLNGPLGLEQGFELARPPEGEGALRIAIDVGGLHPVAEPEFVSMRDESGVERARYSELHAYDAEGDDLVASMHVEGTRIVLRIDDTQAAYPIVIDPLLATQQARLLASDSARAGAFGKSLAVYVDGTEPVVVVGAPNDDRAGLDAGAAYVFRRTNAGWSTGIRLAAADPAAGDHFGASVAVNKSGAVLRIAVGAPDHATSGRVYTYDWNGTVWLAHASFAPSGLSAGADFGAATDFANLRVLVGAPGVNSDAGRVYEFSPNVGDTAYAQTTSMIGSDTAAGDRLGASLRAHGTQLVVAGAPGDDLAAVGDAGSAYVWNVAAGYAQEAKLTAATPAASAAFGTAITFANVGSDVDWFFGEPGASASKGAAHRIRRLSAGTWQTGAGLQQVLTASDGSAGDEFGSALAAYAATGVLLVGAPGDGGVFPFFRQGSMYRFTNSGGTWGFTKKDLGATSVAFDEGGMAVAYVRYQSGLTTFERSFLGEPGDDATTTDAGTVTVRDVVADTIETNLAPDTLSGNRLGYSVAIDGDTAVVGAPNDDDTGPNAGAAYVYVRSGAVWTAQAKLTVPGATGDGWGHSVDVDGDTIVLGTNQGSQNQVQLFTRVAGTWTGPTMLTVAGLGLGDSFGRSVALDGGTLVVGAPGFDVGGTTGAGRAYVFTGSGATYALQGTLELAGVNPPAVNDLFGESVAIAGDTVVVGIPARDAGAVPDVGAAAIFARSAATWSIASYVTGGVTAAFASMNYGRSVAIAADASRVVVGGPSLSSGASHVGEARVFVKSGAAWTADGTIVAPTAELDDEFGYAVGIDADVVLVGAPRRDDGALADAGTSHLFMRTGGTWMHQVALDAPATDDAAGDHFGKAVALAGQTAAIGAPFLSADGSSAGAVYVHTTTRTAGETCGTTADCGGSFTCVDGVCCTTSCGGGIANDCMACSVAAGGTANGTCTALTAAAAPATVCRAAAAGHVCDLVESCIAGNTTCPADAAMLPGVPCNGAPSGTCDLQDTCAGTVGATSTCVDALVVSGTTCRGAVGECDVAETCTGASGACPADAAIAEGTPCGTDPVSLCEAGDTCVGTVGSAATCQENFAPAMTPCRAVAGVCDVAEVCTGTNGTCPTDARVIAGTICHDSTGECDPAESCDGASLDCPADELAKDGTVCGGPVNGDCDAPDVCSAGSCAALVAVAGAKCRGTEGACDPAEYCDGATRACPADVLSAKGTPCRASSGICDVAESCSGDDTQCPTDVVEVAGTPCRAAVGVCDVTEACNGVAALCPADTLVTAGTICRDAAGLCDAPESCSGASGLCPGDEYLSGGKECRASTGVCDGAETCSGIDSSCPSDATGCCLADVECDDGNPCTPDTCSADGLCTVGDPIAGCCTGDADCEDGDACTTDACDAVQHSCDAPQMIADCCSALADCDDADDCTTDTCDFGTKVCGHSPIAVCALDAGVVGTDAGMAETDAGVAGIDAGTLDDAGAAEADAGTTNSRASGCGCTTAESHGPAHAAGWMSLAGLALVLGRIRIRSRIRIRARRRAFGRA